MFSEIGEPLPGLTVMSLTMKSVSTSGGMRFTEKNLSGLKRTSPLFDEKYIVPSAVTSAVWPSTILSSSPSAVVQVRKSDEGYVKETIPLLVATHIRPSCPSTIE